MPSVANVGTLLNTPPIALINTLDSIQAKIPADEIADQVLKPSSTLWSLIRRGKKIDSSEIVYGLFTTEETTNGTYWGTQLLDTSTVDSIQPANQIWSPFYQSVSIPKLDVKLNSGMGAVMNLVEQKLKAAFGSFLMAIAKSAWAISPRNGSLDLDDIDSWVRKTTNTIAGINRSTSSFWKPNANISVTGAGDFLEQDAEKAYLAVTYGADEPDLFIMSHTVYKSFKLHFTSLNRYEKPTIDEEVIVAGFKKHFMYDNAIVMPERFLEDYASGAATSAPNNTVYVLNSKYIYPIFHENDYFNVQPWLQPTNQQVVTTQITALMQLKCNSPRMQVAVTGF